MPDDSDQPRPEPGSVRTGRWSHSYTAAAAAVIAVLGAQIWLATSANPDPALHSIALFAHLGFLILGFGAVLVADYSFALWLFGRTTLSEAVTGTARLHPLIWAGLIGLVVSGVLLRPNLSSGITVLKLGFVTVLTLNGLYAMDLSRQLGALGGAPPTRLLVRGGVASAVSQTCWWGAIIIGFLNAN